MDDSAPTVTNRTDSPPPEQHWVMTRALASAAVFGFIGQWIGDRLGRRLNNTVAHATLKWSMGSFWALMAAYSSLKASAMERGEVVTESPTVAATPKVEKKPDVMNDAKVKTPLSLIEVDTLKDQGPLQSAPELQRS